MALRDNVVKSLRALFDVERDARMNAESPSAAALKQAPGSIYSVWGREDIGGLLSISQNLQDRFADYEAMLDYPDCRTAIEYFASDATQPNMDNGRTVWVTSRDAAIVGTANSLIKRRLRLEDDIYSIAFGLCSMGNDWEEVLITDNGVVGLNHLPAPTMRRVERLEGTLIGYVQDISGRFTAEQDELRKMLAGQAEVPQHVALFEDWQVVHFRLRNNTRRSPYGASVAEPARWIWKRLVMLEDAVMIYKLTRAPQRYAFYVDVTDVPPAKRDAWLQKQKRDLKKKSMVDPRTGRLDMRYNPLSLDEDYVIAVADGRQLARVEVLSGADYQNIDDVGYFQRKLHGALKVPRAYMGQDAPVQGRAILSNEDVRAARVTLQVQKELRNGVERLVRIDQAARGYPAPWQTEFEVCMTVPSGIYELAAMEVKTARADFASRIQPFVSMRWIRENVFKMSDEEIEAITAQAQKEAMQSAELQQKQQALMMAPPIPSDPMGQVQPQGQPQQQQQPTAPPPQLPVAPPSRTEQIKQYDRLQYLEEARDKVSRREHQMLTDKFGELLQNDKSLSSRLDESIGLINDLRNIALRNNNGRVSALPSAAGRRF